MQVAGSLEAWSSSQQQQQLHTSSSHTSSGAATLPVPLQSGDYALVHISRATGHTLRGTPVARTTLTEHHR